MSWVTRTRLVSAARADDESSFELKLRPRRLQEFIGQEKAKELLAIALEAAKSRGEALDHVLLFGPPGLGKTTLATIIANELSVGFQQTSGPSPTPTWIDQVEFKFYMVSGATVTQVDSILKQACAAGNALASFGDIQPAASFNRVDIVPRESTVYSSTTVATTLYLSEVRTCTSGSSCQTALEAANPTSLCP